MIIGFVGYARSGKDTAAKYLLENYPERYFQYSFADPIKEACNLIFDWDDRHSDGELKEVVDPFWNISPRVAYQTLGTEWGRDCIRKDIWIKRAEKIEANSEKDMIIADVRFINEAEWLFNHPEGVLISVERQERAEIGGLANHASEADIPSVMDLADYNIYNNSTIFDLEEKIRCIVDTIQEENGVKYATKN